MKHLKRFNESIIDLLEEIKEDIYGLTTYISDTYNVRVATKYKGDKFIGIYVSIENVYDPKNPGTTFKFDKNINDVFNTIVDFVKLKINSELNIGFYYRNENTDTVFLSEDANYDDYTIVELVIEDKEIGPYFNDYFKL